MAIRKSRPQMPEYSGPTYDERKAMFLMRAPLKPLFSPLVASIRAAYLGSIAHREKLANIGKFLPREPGSDDEEAAA